jgi:hypothetical protein
MVASSNSGFSRCLITCWLRFEFSVLRWFTSSGFREKKATSEPETRADPANNIRVAMMAIIILVVGGWNIILVTTTGKCDRNKSVSKE